MTAAKEVFPSIEAMSDEFEIPADKLDKFLRYYLTSYNRLPASTVRSIRRLRARTGWSYRLIGSEFHLSASTVQKICTRTSYKRIK
jgi:hypothetical protein